MRTDPLSRYRRRMQQGRPVVVLSNRTHGLRATYVDGCRCDPCTDAEAAYWHVKRGRSIVAVVPLERRPFLFCIRGDHRLCPIFVGGQECPCRCHERAERKARTG